MSIHDPCLHSQNSLNGAFQVVLAVQTRRMYRRRASNQLSAQCWVSLMPSACCQASSSATPITATRHSMGLFVRTAKCTWNAQCLVVLWEINYVRMSIPQYLVCETSIKILLRRVGTNLQQSAYNCFLHANYLMCSPLPPFIKYDDNDIIIDYNNIEQRKNTTIFNVKKVKVGTILVIFASAVISDVITLRLSHDVLSTISHSAVFVDQSTSNLVRL